MSSAENRKVVLVTRDAAVAAEAARWDGATLLEPSGVAAWTDDYSDVLSALVRGWSGKTAAAGVPAPH